MRRHIFALTATALPLLATIADVPSAQTRTPAGVETASLDRKADPCVDFYQFACGGWIARNPVSPDRRSFSRFTEVQERNFTTLRRILEAPNRDGDRGKASDYYGACMDEAKIEAAGVMPLSQDLATIDELLNPDDLPVLIAHLHAIGVAAFFRFGAQANVLEDATQEIAVLDQSGLSLPDRDYYLKTDSRSDELRKQFAATVQRIFALAGSSAEQAQADAAAVLAVETALARAQLDRVRRRDPRETHHSMSLDQLQAATPNFSWRKYALAAEAPKFQVLNVSVPEYIKAFDRLIVSRPTSDLKAYLRWRLIHESADLLPKAFADADFEFFTHTLAGQPQPSPRWRRCVSDTDRSLGDALGQAFVEETFGAQAKADTLQMVHDIEDAMRKDIDAAAWMSDDTKKAALAKLNKVVDRIGYPESWRDYSTVRIARDDALGNRQRAAAFERARTLAKIGQMVDRTEWSMTPPTVNAYYSPDRNNINFPAGILQPPFYRAGRDAAVNYGAAGGVISHELTHGFDDHGRKFDGDGILRDWWTPADAKAYEERVSCIADQYSSYVVAGDANINGRLTLGENTADNGGVRLALMAYLAGPGAKLKEKIDGFTPEQRVFLGWAQVWCETTRPEAERLKAATNPHASNKYRVNGPLSNMPEFAKAFSCKANAPMVRQPLCRVW